MTPIEFRAARLALSISRAQLAIKLGCSERAVRHWERGTRRIPGPVAKLVTLMRNDHDS